MTDANGNNENKRRKRKLYYLKSYRGLARVLNPNSTSHLFARFIFKKKKKKKKDK
jgi:hypothetical protein